ncbi:MAG: general secretion pathway protein GspK [Sedimentisphaerales bacterium]|nr:general secretion pathway protein GspK [Sedimentisphaerales bacterium]
MLCDKMCIDRNKKGLVIITVLWTVVILTVMVAILGRKSRLDLKVGASRMDAVRCKWACRAGIEKAMAVLKDDITENDSPIDTWGDNAEDFNDVMLERCWFTVKVIDEAGKLNINTATKDQLMGLPNMFVEIADAIIDWRDENDSPEAMGVESGYYESMTFGYSARNGPFKTIRELLLVKDITEDLFYGEDTNLNGQLDYNERDGDLSPPLDDGDDVLDVGWAAYLTCYSSAEGQNQGNQTQNQSNQSNQNQSSSQNQNDQNQSNQNQNNQDQNNQNSQNQNNQSDQNNQNQNQNNQNNDAQGYARININTASEIVLAALFGGGDEAARNALAIIDYRESVTEGIQDPSELVDQQILDQNTFSQIENYITTSSDIFTIRCIATADWNGPNGARLTTEAVVDRSETPCKVLFWYQGVNN